MCKLPFIVSDVPTSPPHPMAAQMAQLLLHSDMDELREVVKRWLAQAPTGEMRKHYERLGGQLIELKEALAAQPMQPMQDELELALTMMLKLAQDAGKPFGS